jgi:branched-chain amino acid aminotransferase
MQDLVAVNGQVFKPSEAKISVFDRGFLYGDGVYEVARGYDRIFFALEDHIERLYRSAERIYLDIGLKPDDLIKEIYRIYEQCEARDAYMRVVITRGEHPIALDPTRAVKPNIVTFYQPVPQQDPKLYAEGMDVITASIFRNPKKSLDPNVKSGNYLNNVLALGEARRKGAHDAVMVNRDGQITEGTTWNIFMVQDGVLVSPPDDADILHGITRKTLKKIANQAGIKWQERYFTPTELKEAQEVLSTGTIKEVMAIRTVDGVKIGSGRPGPVTLRLASLYREYVNDYCLKARGRYL